MKFFWKNFCKFWVRAENFSATPHPQPQFSATEISAIPHFWPKTPFWGLLRSCSTWKWHQHHENCFGVTFWYFWWGPKIFWPPRTHNPHFDLINFFKAPILGQKWHFLEDSSNQEWHFWPKSGTFKKFMRFKRGLGCGVVKIFSALTKNTKM